MGLAALPRGGNCEPCGIHPRGRGRESEKLIQVQRRRRGHHLARSHEDDAGACVMTGTLILLRHGESEWNAKNLFTGWVDVGLSPKGEGEATRGGELLVENNLLPDVMHTSVLRLSLIHISEPTRLLSISYAVFCLKK